MFYPQKATELGNFDACDFGFRVKDRRKKLWNKATEARMVSGMSLNGALVEIPLCEAVNLKPGLLRRTQGIRDAKNMEYLLRRAANRQ